MRRFDEKIVADLTGEWSRHRLGSLWKAKLYTYRPAGGFAHTHSMSICLYAP